MEKHVHVINFMLVVFCGSFWSATLCPCFHWTDPLFFFIRLRSWSQLWCDFQLMKTWFNGRTQYWSTRSLLKLSLMVLLKWTFNHPNSTSTRPFLPAAEVVAFHVLVFLVWLQTVVCQQSLRPRRFDQLSRTLLNLSSLETSVSNNIKLQSV